LFHEETNVFGTALLKAIALERVVRFPRIILDKKLNSHVIDSASRFPRHWNFVIKDTDGFYFPDYLMPLVLSTYQQQRVVQMIEERLVEFRDNANVLPKYQWLRQKFEAAIADSAWRRDIHRANDALMQRHLASVQDAESLAKLREP
jgi:hypothetical protein